MNEWTKSLLHQWMYIKQDGGPADPMYFRCVRCGIWKISVHYQIGKRSLKRYSANYSPGSTGPWVNNALALPCEGIDSPSLFSKWFSGVGSVGEQNKLLKMGVVTVKGK